MTRTYTDERRWANTDPSLHANHHVSDECVVGEHGQCDDRRCACPCWRHVEEMKLKLEHPQLRSLAEASEESEAA